MTPIYGVVALLTIIAAHLIRGPKFALASAFALAGLYVVLVRLITVNM